MKNRILTHKLTFFLLCSMVLGTLLLVIMEVRAANAVTVDGSVDSSGFTTFTAVTLTNTYVQGTVTPGATSWAAALPHTTGSGSNRALLVGISFNGSGTSTLPRLMEFYFQESNGTIDPMYQVVSQSIMLTQTPYQGRAVAIFALINPPQNNSGKVYVAFNGTWTTGCIVGAVNFQGVDQNTPFGTPVASSNNYTNTGIDIQVVSANTMNSIEMVFDTVFAGGQAAPTLYAGTAQTQVWAINSGTNSSGGGSYQQANSSSSIMHWFRGTATGYMGMVAVPINPANGSPAPSNTPTTTASLTRTPTPTNTTTPGITYSLSVNANSNGTITAPATSPTSHNPGDVVTITASANSNYHFVNWTGDVSTVANVTSASTNITMNGNYTIYANFAANVVSPISYIGDIGSNSNNSGGTLTVTTNTGVTAGDDILIGYVTDASQDIALSVTDSVGNAYNQIADAPSTGNNRTYIFAAYNVTALPSSSTITFNESIPSGGTAITAQAAVVSVFRGLAPSGALEQTSVGPTDGTAVSSTSPSSNAITTVQSTQLIIGAVGTKGDDTGNPGSWSSGWTAGPVAGNSGETVSLGYQIVSSSGSYTASKTSIRGVIGQPRLPRSRL